MCVCVHMAAGDDDDEPNAGDGMLAVLSAQKVADSLHKQRA